MSRRQHLVIRAVAVAVIAVLQLLPRASHDKHASAAAAPAPTDLVAQNR